MSSLRDRIQEQHDYKPLLFADGFDEAILGVGWSFDKPLSVAYDKHKCIKILMKRDKMSRTDAEEYFSFNVEGAYVGEATPVFVELIK